jgi:hypothetical protein
MTAPQSVQVAASATLTISTVDVVTLASFSDQIRVINRSATAADEIWFTVGSTKLPPANPTVGGADCYLSKAAPSGVLVRWPSTVSGLDGVLNGAVVKLISSVAAPYTVQGSDTR